MLSEGAAKMLDGAYLFEYLDGLSLKLKEVLVLDGEGFAPEFLVFLLRLIHFSLLEEFLAAVLVATEGPVEAWLY